MTQFLELFDSSDLLKKERVNTYQESFKGSSVSLPIVSQQANKRHLGKRNVSGCGGLKKIRMKSSKQLRAYIRLVLQTKNIFLSAFTEAANL